MQKDQLKEQLTQALAGIAEGAYNAAEVGGQAVLGR